MTAANARLAFFPVVRVDLKLGTYAPLAAADDPPDWIPIEYAVHAHHATTLTHDALNVVERSLERLTLVLENEYDDELDGPSRVELALPDTVEGIAGIIAILDNARDYLAREATTP